MKSTRVEARSESPIRGSRSGARGRARRRRIDWAIVIASLVFAVSCSGGGCGGCAAFEPIPGGFPAAERNLNAAQVRVSQTGLAAITADPARLITELAGGMNGVVKFNAPVSCTGSTPTCCPGGNPKSPCGPIDIDLNRYTGDLPRLEVKPAQGAGRIDVTLRARVKTETDIPVKVTIPIIGTKVECGVRVDTTPGTAPDIQIDAPINLVQDAAGTTRLAVGTVALSQLTTDDVKLTGSFTCQGANLALSFFLGLLTDQLTSAIQDTVQDQTCKGCPSGDVGECGTPATACTDKVCTKADGQCMQELGLAGRARGTALFGSFSPGTTGAIDLYEVAGGYATTNSSGIALGVLGGILPGGAPRDRCGPPALVAPARAAIPQSPFFQGNTRPDTGQPFAVAIGVHKSQLEQLAWAGYDGGLFCLTVGTGTVAQLSTGMLSLISRSLGRLAEDNAPMAVGLRPQRPPELTLGKNVFTTDGQGDTTLAEPLVDVRFSGLEIDFFASIDEQYVRVFTVVADVHLPVGLQVTAMGELAPVLGDLDNAFTNISVKNSEAVAEAPADLAGLFPSVLALVLPELAGGLPSFALPTLGGLKLDVSAVTGVPVTPGGTDTSFLAIYADLAPATLGAPVETTLSLGEIAEPDAAVAGDPRRWRGARPPAVALELGGSADDLEFSHRIDGGAWSAWSRNARPTLAPAVFWLPGTHRVEARARRIGRPDTIDPTPVSIEVSLGAGLARRAPGRPFHGQAGQAGCGCQTGGSAGGAAPLALVLGAVLLPLRRIRRRAGHLLRGARRLGAVAWLAAIAMLPGCSCGADYCGDTECLPGDIEGTALGRFTSVAADERRVLAATYDQVLGDLVVVDVTDAAAPKQLAVDGVPDDATPTHEKSSYRRGIEEPGPDVGAWTSIAISNGKGKVAYQDRDAGTLKYAFEKKAGAWESYVVDPAEGGEEVGRYASMVIDADGHPAIAYLAVGVDDGSGKRITELRLARAGAGEPKAGDWTTHVIAAAPGSCAGRCGAGEACVADAAASVETCKAVTADCAAACGSGAVCVAGACTAEIAPPATVELPGGTGLYVSLVVLPDGRLAAAYYDRSGRALKLAVESAAGSNELAETVLHGGATGDRGLWASAAVDESGTIHVAYQDAIGDQLMYTTWNGAPGAPEVVDDGQRAGDRTHPVGAGAALYLVGGAPAIAYQDGLTADVYVATRGAASWTPAAISTGPAVDGVSIGAAVGPGGVPYLAWDRLDPSRAVPHTLAVQNP